MEKLPYEIFLEISNFLEIYEILKIITTSRNWVNITQMDYFWKKRLEFDFGIKGDQNVGTMRDKYVKIYRDISDFELKKKRRKARVKRRFKWGYFELLNTLNVKKAINPASRRLIRSGLFDFYSIDPNKKYDSFITELIEHVLRNFGFYFYIIDNLKKFVFSVSKSQPDIVPDIVQNLKVGKYMIDTFQLNHDNFSFLFDLEVTIFPFFIDQVISTNTTLKQYYHDFRKLHHDLEAFAKGHHYDETSEKLFSYITKDKRHFELKGFFENICFIQLPQPNAFRRKLFDHLVKHQKLFRKCFNGVQFLEIVEKYCINSEDEEIIDRLLSNVFKIITKSRTYLTNLVVSSVVQKYNRSISIHEEHLIFLTRLLEQFSPLDNINLHHQEEEEEEHGGSDVRSVVYEVLFGGSDENPKVVRQRVKNLFTGIPYKKIFKVFPDLYFPISKYYLQTNDQLEYSEFLPRLREIFLISDRYPSLREDVREHLKYRFSEEGIPSLVSTHTDLARLIENISMEFVEEEVMKKLVKKPLEFIKIVKNYSAIVFVFQKFPGFQNDIFLSILKKKKFEQKIGKRGIKQFRKNYRREFSRFRN